MDNWEIAIKINIKNYFNCFHIQMNLWEIKEKFLRQKIKLTNKHFK